MQLSSVAVTAGEVTLIAKAALPGAGIVYVSAAYSIGSTLHEVLSQLGTKITTVNGSVATVTEGYVASAISTTRLYVPAWYD